jgi:hypothetical protein
MAGQGKNRHVGTKSRIFSRILRVRRQCSVPICFDPAVSRTSDIFEKIVADAIFKQWAELDGEIIGRSK